MYFEPISDRLTQKLERTQRRGAILDFLLYSPCPRSPREIFAAACHDKVTGRKIILCMKRAGELVSPARGLYTIPGHPCLAQATDVMSPVLNVRARRKSRGSQVLYPNGY